VGTVLDLGYLSNSTNSLKNKILMPGELYTVAQYITSNPDNQIGINVCATPSNVPLFAQLRSNNGTIMFSNTLTLIPYHKNINATDGHYSLFIKNVGGKSTSVNAVLAPSYYVPRHQLVTGGTIFACLPNY
jgi:hypothetical protein